MDPDARRNLFMLVAVMVVLMAVWYHRKYWKDGDPTAGLAFPKTGPFTRVN